MEQVETGRTCFRSRRACGLLGVVALAVMLRPLPGIAEDPAPPLPPPRPSDLTAPAPSAPETPKAESDCAERLTRQGFRLETRSPAPEGECAIEDPVLVASLPDGVALSAPALMACSMAEQLSHWMHDVVRPEAERQLQSAPTKILIGTSYECRNQRSGEKLSEHAFGNAVDVMGFEFAKRPALSIADSPGDSPEAAFQSAIRKGACPIFMTVLGPGSDEAHKDHLHLDMRARKNEYRICQ